MAILAAFNSPEVEVLGLTSIYGNVPTAMATRNALTLCHLAGRTDVSCGAALHPAARHQRSQQCKAAGAAARQTRARAVCRRRHQGCTHTGPP
jgi:inosine-uridine nucleoside N-ribohydrolase